jgi:hypothetical protein
LIQKKRVVKFEDTSDQEEEKVRDSDSRPIINMLLNQRRMDIFQSNFDENIQAHHRNNQFQLGLIRTAEKLKKNEETL